MADMEKQLQESKDSYDEQHMQVTEMGEELAKCQEHEYAREVNEANSLAQSKETDAIRLAEELDRTAAEVRRLKQNIAELKEQHAKKVSYISNTIKTRSRIMIADDVSGQEYPAFEAPPPESNIVQRELKHMKDKTCIQVLVNKLEDVPVCLRLVRYSATVLGDVDTLNAVAVMQNRVAGYVLDTNNIMNKVRLTTGIILDNLKWSFRWLLEGTEEKEAPRRFHDIHDNFNKMKIMLDEHSKRIHAESDIIQNDSRLGLLMGVREGQHANPYQKAANLALKMFMSIIHIANFLSCIHNYIEVFNKSIMLQMLERPATEEHRRFKSGSWAFQHESLQSCAHLVALQLLCDEYTKGMDGLDEKIKRQLVEDVPRVEAEQRLNELFEKLNRKLEIRRMAEMESLSESKLISSRLKRPLG